MKRKRNANKNGLVASDVLDDKDGFESDDLFQSERNSEDSENED